MNTVTIVLIVLSAMINIILFAMMGIDKSCAKKRLNRIPEVTLFAFALCFGAIGGTAAMFLFRHKTRHWYFRVFFPSLAVIQIALFILMTIYL